MARTSPRRVFRRSIARVLEREGLRQGEGTGSISLDESTDLRYEGRRKGVAISLRDDRRPTAGYNER